MTADGTAPGAAAALLRLDDICKSFGPTFANRALTLEVGAGEVIGLIGANGAGKSTLMRILTGVVTPDSGRLWVGGTEMDRGRFSPSLARRLGVRIATQELSLCPSLTVTENFYIEAPHLARGLLWRRQLRHLARASIAAIFPDHGIDVAARVETLPIAQRQMIEIARAGSDPGLRLLILDEPTSSLDARLSQQLRSWIEHRARAGVAVLFISHKLQEVAALAQRLVVMRGGMLVCDRPAAELTVSQMVDLMAGEASRTLQEVAREHASTAAGRALALVPAGRFSDHPVPLHAGRIVGLAGLEGNGQRRFLHAVFAASRAGMAGWQCAPAAFVSGDRAAEGVFPRWSVRWNTTIAALAASPLSRWLRPAGDAGLADHWLGRVRIDASRADSPILELSGGNQQKVLMARALATDADTLLLDDPTRGVDVSVKRDFYRLIADAARHGKLVLWHSSEDAEFLECDMVLVFRNGRIVAELEGPALTADAILEASFAHLPGTGPTSAASRRGGRWTAALPLATLLAMLAAVAMLNRNVLSLFGLDLLASAAVPLVLVALAQMWVVGGSEIDLGAGAFAGLISVLAATLLVDTPPWGWVAIAAAFGAYCLLGLLVRLRQIPAIVVTLGASFVWSGVGYGIQPTPGGSAPDWLAAIPAAAPLGVPASAWIIGMAGLLAWAVCDSRAGVVLRGFGANPQAMEQSGWSAAYAWLTRYALAGGFLLAAGLTMTAISTASDINAGGSFTLLGVAAVVIGGSALAGGRITPLGVVCGALTLSLIGSLLGFLGVSTDYNAAVQGGVLIATLMARSLTRLA